MAGPEQVCCLLGPPARAAPGSAAAARRRWAGRTQGLLKQIPRMRVRSMGVLLVKGRGNRGLLWQHQQPTLFPVRVRAGLPETSRRLLGGAGCGCAEQMLVAMEGNSHPHRCLLLPLAQRDPSTVLSVFLNCCGAERKVVAQEFC